MKWIFTHGDVDGVTSAALVKAVFTEAKIFFSHPSGLLTDLQANITKNDDLIILDIALDEKDWRDIINFLSKLNGKIIYIDHHPLPTNFKKPNFTLIHKVGISTAELTYKYFKDNLSRDYSRVALFGAVGDYSDETDYVRHLYNLWDKRLIYFESGILCQGLEATRKMYDFKRKLVVELSENLLPSQNGELVKRAVEMSILEEKMRLNIKKNVVKLNNMAYIIDPGGSLSRAARYAYLEGESIVGVAIEYKRDIAIMSIRRRKEYSQINLDRILRKISLQFGGSGGGHADAAGARIPINNINKFLSKLDEQISKHKFLLIT